jgi:hypothetical protein
VTLERSLYKALHELQRLQAARDGQAVPLPEAVGVDISISTRDEGIKWLCLAKASALQAREAKNPSAIKSHVKLITWEIEWRNRRFCWP